MSSASAVAAAANVVVIPLVASLYGPVAVGLSAAVMLVGGILATGISGRYEVGAAVASHTEAGSAESSALAELALRTSSVAAVVVQIPMIFATNMGFLNAAWNWLPLFALTSVAGSIQTLLDTRSGRFAPLSWLVALRPVVFACAAWILAAQAASPPTAGLLCAAYVIAGAPALVRAVWLVRRGAKLHDRAHGGLWSVARRHARYPKYQVPAALLNNLSSSVFGLLVGALYGAAALGAFSLALRLTSLPVLILGGPINTIYLREAVRVRDDTPAAVRSYGHAVAGSMAAGAVAIPLIFVGLPLVTQILGSEWTEVTAFVVVTFPLMLAEMIAAPANSALVTYSAQRALLNWRIALAVTPALLLFLSAKVGLTAVQGVLAAATVSLALSTAYAAFGRVMVGGKYAPHQGIVRG